MPKYKEVNWDKRTHKGYEVSVNPFGNIYYTLDGKKHREDGPAVIWPNGYKAWCLNGELHRTDGPAVIWADGDKAWYLNGESLSKKDFTIEMIKQLDASELFTPQELAKMRLDKSS